MFHIIYNMNLSDHIVFCSVEVDECSDTAVKAIFSQLFIQAITTGAS